MRPISTGVMRALPSLQSHDLVVLVEDGELPRHTDFHQLSGYGGTEAIIRSHCRVNVLSNAPALRFIQSGASRLSIS